MRDASFDTPAFFFALKFFALVALLGAAARFGADAFAVPWLSSDAAAEARMTASPYMALEGVRGIGPQVLLPPAQRAEAFMDARVPLSGRFIGVNLAEGWVRLYEDGTEREEYPILKRAQAGTHWNLPTGMTAVAQKYTVQRSRVAGVAFPYAVEAANGFLLHGWPIDTGTQQPVPEAYEGGGVRLASPAAQRIFRFAREGVPLYIYNPAARARRAGAPPAALRLYSTALPQLSAKSFAVADVARGEIIAARGLKEPRPIASLTKLMTAVVAMERLTPTEWVRVPSRRARYRAEDLLAPLFLRSDNKVARALAAAAGGTEDFVAGMNARARAWGMRRTTFADPSGLSPGNTASPLDVLKLAQRIYAAHAYLLAVSRKPRATIVAESGALWRMENQNRFAGDPFFIGGKLGFTDEAKKTGLSLFSVPFGNETRTIAIVVLGSKDWKRDTDALLDWLRRTARPSPEGKFAGSI